MENSFSWCCSTGLCKAAMQARVLESALQSRELSIEFISLLEVGGKGGFMDLNRIERNRRSPSQYNEAQFYQAWNKSQ